MKKGIVTKMTKDINIDLKQLQSVQLEILIEFDRICKKNKINYQLFAGTLLGAIRHQGFIPWDDDVDVCMLRKDYDKFIDVCSRDLDSRYFLQTHETDAEYIHSFMRIRKNSTLSVQKGWTHVKMHHGIFIDIFPMDKILPDRLIGKFQYHCLYSLQRIKGIKRRKNINKFYYYLLKPFSIQWFNRLETKIMTVFENKYTNYSTCLADGGKEMYFKYRIQHNRFYETIEKNFEGNKFPIPREYDRILTSIYGDYMSLPPIEEQHPHHGIIELRFDITK